MVMIKVNRPFALLISLATMLLFMFSQSALAATASVSSTKLAKEEVFQLKIIAEENLDSDDIDFSVLKEDFYVGTPRFGFYTNITNGRKSVKSEWTLALAPLRSGILTIPSFQVGKNKTNPIKLTVSVDPTAKTQDDLVEIQVQLQKSEFYLGELNQLDTRLIIKADARQIQKANIVQPSVQSADSAAFSLEPIGERKEYQTVIDGMEVIAVEQSYKITASQAGKFVINGPALKGAIIDGSRRSNTSRIIPVDTKPEIFVVSVMDQPENYQGTWLPSSDLILEQKWFDESGQEIKNPENISLTVGSPMTRQITLSAKGIASEHLPNLKVAYPDKVRVYEEAPQITQEQDTAKLTLKQVLIAKSAGEVELPDVNLSWWNTGLRKADTATVKGVRLMIEEGEDIAQIAAPLTQVSQQPETAPRIETVTIKDAGIWPHITLLLSIGWLVTFGILIRTRRSVPRTGEETNQEPETGDLNALISAIKSRDGFKSQALLDNWLNEHPSIETGTESEIKRELSQMQASLYAKDAYQWQDKKLIKLLRATHKKRHKTEAKPDLASL